MARSSLHSGYNVSYETKIFQSKVRKHLTSIRNKFNSRTFALERDIQRCCMQHRGHYVKVLCRENGHRNTIAIPLQKKEKERRKYASYDSAPPQRRQRRSGIARSAAPPPRRPHPCVLSPPEYLIHILYPDDRHEKRVGLTGRRRV